MTSNQICQINILNQEHGEKIFFLNLHSPTEISNKERLCAKNLHAKRLTKKTDKIQLKYFWEFHAKQKRPSNGQRPSLPFHFLWGGEKKSKRSNSHEAVIALVLLLEEMVFLEIRLINKTAQKKKTPSANLWKPSREDHSSQGSGAEADHCTGHLSH